MALRQRKRQKQRLHPIRQTKKRSARRVFVWLVKLTLIIGLVVGAVAFFRSLTVVAVECTTNQSPCRSEIVEALNAVRGVSLIAANTKIKEALLHPAIQTYDVSFVFPRSYKVVIVEKEPAFAIKKRDDEYVLVSQDGAVLGSTQATGLPTIIVGDASVEDQLILAAGKLLTAVGKEKNVKVGTVDSLGLVVDLPEGIRVYLPTDRDLDVTVGSLLLTLSWLNKSAEGSRIVSEREIREIDFRFKNPVLR